MSLDTKPQCGGLAWAIGDDTAVETSILGLKSGKEREVTWQRREREATQQWRGEEGGNVAEERRVGGNAAVEEEGVVNFDNVK